MRLAPGLHRIGNDVVAAYLVVDETGVTVVDAGLAGHYRYLVHELHLVGRSLTDVRGIVLTHGDTDHLGFAERLRVAHGVPVHVHAADAARARGEVRPHAHWGRWRLGPTVRFLAYASTRGGLRTTYVGEVVEIEDGQTLYGYCVPMPLAADCPDTPDLPHRLIIYQRPLVEDFDGRELLVQIRMTVIHELAHAFGWSERDLDAFESRADPFGEDEVARLLEEESRAEE
ncbi:MAG TPA: MBL fold metallo-hydrolase [Actinotalea sp.]|nr:MBL fold metallo-hydrolase [Actinotalea sp.]